MVGLGLLLVFFALHAILWLIGAAIGDSSGLAACASPPCDVYIEEAIEQLDRRPALSLDYIFGGITGFIGTVWDFISFGQYDILRGGLGMPWDLAPYGVRFAGLAAGAIGIITLGTTLLGRR